MRRGGPVLLLALLAAAAAGCGGHPTAAPLLPSSPVAVTTSVPGTRSTPVNKTVTDPVLGDSVTVLAVVRGYPTAGAPLVLVQLRAAAGDRVARGEPLAAFSLLEPGGRADAATEPSGALAAAYPPLQPAQAGRTETGWLAFAVHTTSGLTLRYDRATLVVVGSDQTVPAAAYRVPLPE